LHQTDFDPETSFAQTDKPDIYCGMSGILIAVVVFAFPTTTLDGACV